MIRPTRRKPTNYRNLRNMQSTSEQHCTHCCCPCEDCGNTQSTSVDPYYLRHKTMWNGKVYVKLHDLAGAMMDAVKPEAPTDDPSDKA